MIKYYGKKYKNLWRELNMEYGYIRVSTKDQNDERQLIAMKDFGIGEKNLFIDKQSGKDFLRPNYQKMLRKLKLNDLVVIKSIDRLGRNYAEILEQWRIITKEKKSNIVVLDIPLLDTRAKHCDLTGVFICDLVLQILSYVAQTERESIRKRQAEGIAAAKARGVHMGRPKKEKPSNFDAVKQQYQNNEINLDIGAKLVGVSIATFIRWIKSN